MSSSGDPTATGGAVSVRTRRADGAPSNDDAAGDAAAAAGITGHGGGARHHHKMDPVFPGDFVPKDEISLMKKGGGGHGGEGAGLGHRGDNPVVDGKVVGKDEIALTHSGTAGGHQQPAPNVESYHHRDSPVVAGNVVSKDEISIIKSGNGKEGIVNVGNAGNKDGASLVSRDKEASAVDGSKDAAGHGPAGAPVTGGGRSQDGKLCYGYASTPGKRPAMEDFYDSRIDGVSGEQVGLFGVYDGHGGARAAEYVKENLFSNMIKHPKFISDTECAIAETYTRTDSEFLKTDNNQNRDAGSTASTAIVVGNRLLVANVGDSRAVICRGGKAFAASRDHKPDHADEKQRIEDAGGFVMWAGTWRVGGVLAVSRAFGDKLLKQYVVADPDIKEEKVDDSLEFLIIASDGLWDVVTNEEAVAMVRPIDDAEQAAKKLVMEASQRGSADNITCLVVRFVAAGAAKGSNVK